MAAGGLGSIIEISQGVIDKWNELDNKIKNIDANLEKVGNKVSGFINDINRLGGGASAVSGLVEALKNIGNINIGAGVSGQMQQIEQSASATTASVTKTAEVINSLSAVKNYKTNALPFKEEDFELIRQRIEKVKADLSTLNSLKISLKINGDGIGPIAAQIDSVSQKIKTMSGLLLNAYGGNQFGFGMMRQSEGLNALKTQLQDLRKLMSLEGNSGTLTADLEKLQRLLTTMGQENSFVQRGNEIIAKIHEIELAYERLKQAGKATYADGTDTIEAKHLAARRNELQEELALMQRGLDQVQRVEEEKTKKQEAESKRRIAQAKREADQAAKEAERKAKKEADAAAYINPQNALSAARKEAMSIKEITDALKQLKAARDNVKISGSSTIQDKKNFAELNAEIRRLQGELRKAKDLSGELRSSFRSMGGITDQLRSQFAMLFSVQQVGSFIKSIAEVRGNFELQQVALEAILQDKPKADSIFQKTVALAVRSPFRIQQLVSYTKQLAAYRIESDKLYDTTKRLADVSAGLGVDMQRLILAYGQVKAAAYLRGQEVRQFTEAGINLYQELADYYQVVRGETYSTAQIVDMISKRQVVFEDIEGVFKRLTDQGGLFYNMQEVQAETLRGKISNLKDSYDVMLNSIGKDNQGLFSGSIDAANAILRNWEAIADVIKALVPVVISLSIHAKQIGGFQALFTSMPIATAKFTSLTGLITNGFAKASQAVTAFGANLKSALIGNWYIMAIFAIIGAITHLVGYLNSCNEAARKVNDAFYSLEVQIMKNQKSFRSAADSVSEQRKALGELVSIADNAGLTIDFKINELSDNDIKEYYDNLSARLRKFNNVKQAVGFALNDIDSEWSWGGLLGEDIDEDSQDFAESAARMTSYAGQLQSALNILSANWSKLTEEQRKYLSEGMKTQGEQETQLDYLERLRKSIANVRDADANLEDQLGHQDYWQISKALGDTSFAFDMFAIDRNEFVHELDGLFNEIKNRIPDWQRYAKENPLDFKAAIDATTAEQQWDALSTEFANSWLYSRFGINVDAQQVEDETKKIGQQIDDYFAGRTFKLNIDVSGLPDINSWFSNVEKGEKSLLEKIKDRINAQNTARRQDQYYNKNPKSRYSFQTNFDYSANQKAIDDLTEQAKAAGIAQEEINKALNGGKNPKKNNAAHKSAAKRERDIISERISALRALESEYDKALQRMTSSDAAKRVMGDYAEELKYVGLNLSAGFVPDKESIIKQLEKLAQNVKDFKKKSQIFREIGKLKVEIETDKFEKQLNKAEKDVDKAFSGFELGSKLRSLGLTNSQIDQLFPNIAKNYEAAKDAIEKAYSGVAKGEKAVEKYNQAMTKLREKQRDENEKMLEGIVKSYGRKLSEQLQLDIWYYTELSKIRNWSTQDEMDNIISLPDNMRRLYEENLKKEYQEKTNKNIFDEFKESETYITLFKNLDTAGKATVQRLRKYLDDLKSSMKDLSPTQAREIAKIYDDLDAREIDINPFKAVADSLKEINALRAAGRDEDFLNDDIANLSEANNQLKEEVARMQMVLTLRESGNDLALLTAEHETEIARYAGETNNSLAERIALYKGIISENDNAIFEDTTDLGKYAKARKAVAAFSEAWGKVTGMVSKAWGKISGLLDSMGVDMDGVTADVVDIGSTLADAAMQAFMWYLQQKALTIATEETTVAQEALGVAAKSAMGPIGYILIALEAIVSVMTVLFGNRDKRLQKQIEKLQNDIEDLEYQFDKLKKAMDDALSTDKVVAYKNASVQALRAQIKNYEQMIRLERDKKKTDDSKIREYQNAIRDLYDDITELQESFTESLGGFGSGENFKSAAQEFADAWVDAFNEGEDTLAALEGSFNDFFDNLAKKQIALRASDRYIKPILQAFDDAVSEESEEGVNVTKNELERINRIKKANLEGYNQYVESLMEMLGISPNGADSNLSALTQGIQGVTEQTAEALESLLNSMRFFLATQQGDVAAIRMMLEVQYGAASSSSSATNPMLTELQAQTMLMRSIDNSFGSVIRQGHRLGSAGIKVFMD